MPLPPPNAPWPPPEAAAVQRDLAAWSAWWSGDPDQLAHVYGGTTGGSHPTERSFTERGGVAGAVRRWFWGEPTSPGERRSKLHIPLAAEIAQTSADLLFGQPPTVTAADKATQGRVDALMGELAPTMLHEAAEACAALGHVFLRVGWDRDISPEAPLLSVVDADAAHAVHRWGRLAEVMFVREWRRDTEVLRHFELHEPGTVWHAAYLGDIRSLGRTVPLQAHPETAGVVVDGMVADDRRPGSGIETGIPMLDVVGVGNARSRTWRHLPAARDLGRADVSGVEGALDALDDVMSSWMRDIRHGRSRIHVPTYMLDDAGRGKGATADLDREVYVALNSPPAADGSMQMSATQFKIRHEEHRASAAYLVERVVGGAGYSPQTFGLDSDTSLTATEAWSRQVRTQHTRNGKLRRWRPAVRDVTRVWLAVDQAQFSHVGPKGDPASAIKVEFADTVSESQLSRAQTASALRTAEAASTRTLVELVHNDWDSARVDEEVARILAEQRSGLPIDDHDDNDAPTEERGHPR